MVKIIALFFAIACHMIAVAQTTPPNACWTESFDCERTVRMYKTPKNQNAFETLIRLSPILDSLRTAVDSLKAVQASAQSAFTIQSEERFHIHQQFDSLAMVLATGAPIWADFVRYHKQVKYVDDSMVVIMQTMNACESLLEDRIDDYEAVRHQSRKVFRELVSYVTTRNLLEEVCPNGVITWDKGVLYDMKHYHWNKYDFQMLPVPQPGGW